MTVCCHARRIGEIGRVACQLTPANGVFEGAVKHGVHVTHREGRESLAIALAAALELGIESVDLRRGELLQLQGAQSGQDVALDVGHVGAIGGRTDGVLDRR